MIHGANWIDEGLPGAGNILTFNNGDRPGYSEDYSTVAEIAPPVDEFGNYNVGPTEPFGPAAPVWTHGEPGDYYGSGRQCGAFRLPNGNTLISLSPGGYIFEVTQAGTTVWDYYHGTNIPRSQRYWADCGGVDVTHIPSTAGFIKSASGQPNPSRGTTRLCFELAGPSHVAVEVFDVSGRCVAEVASGDFGAGDNNVRWNGRDDEGHDLSGGIYFALFRTKREIAARKIVLTR